MPLGSDGWPGCSGPKAICAGALAAAKLANDNELVEDLLAEMGDWKELAKIYAKVDVEALAASPNGGQKLARIMVFRHLAGEKQACDLAAAAALKAWKQRQGHGAYQSLLGALVANDRIDQAIEAAKPQEVRAAFELLVAQSRMKEAFRLVKIDVPIPAKIDWKAWLKDAKGANIQERLLLACQVLRALHVAGEDEQARELIGCDAGRDSRRAAGRGQGRFRPEVDGGGGCRRPCGEQRCAGCETAGPES